MVQKSKAKRGRPRAYDRDIALARSMEVFWDTGYAATSLDDISAKTGMNRPSLYGAFGDKRALYREAIAHYRANGRAAMQEALVYDKPLRHALRRAYESALSLYFSGGNSARGCFMIGTALTEAAHDPEIRTALADGLNEIDAAFEARIRFAQENGELRSEANPAVLAKLASAVLYFLAVRSRAGEPREALAAMAEAGVNLICGVERKS